MISRRDFIRQTALAAGGMLISSSPVADFYLSKKPKVIILGAGFAGLAAAKWLHEKHIDFVVLEARKRIGGRVFSYTIDEPENLVIELGAEWVGNSHTRLIELIGEMGLELENNQLDTRLIYKGEFSEQTEFSKGWDEKYKKILENYHHFREEDKVRLDKIDWWRYLVNNGCKDRDLDLKELFDSTDFGESIRYISAYSALSEYADSSEKNEMDQKIKGGNAMLAKKIAEKIGADKIKTGHKVQRIVQAAGKVKVYCENGEIFEADKLICTAPTLATKNIRWEPALPLAMRDAMDQLQYARINKNPVLFGERFWKDERYDLMTDQPGHYFYHATKNQKSAKGVLISYTIGDKAAVIANQSDEWKANMIEQSLSVRYKDVKKLIQKQANYYWGEDEYSKGAYAIYGKGQWYSLVPILRKPFMNAHFAGEHIAETQGFMEGAVVSGEDAAKAIV